MSCHVQSTRFEMPSSAQECDFRLAPQGGNGACGKGKAHQPSRPQPHCAPIGAMSPPNRQAQSMGQHPSGKGEWGPRPGEGLAFPLHTGGRHRAWHISQGEASWSAVANTKCFITLPLPLAFTGMNAGSTQPPPPSMNGKGNGCPQRSREGCSPATGRGESTPLARPIFLGMPSVSRASHAEGGAEASHVPSPPMSQSGAPKGTDQAPASSNARGEWFLGVRLGEHTLGGASL